MICILGVCLVCALEPIHSVFIGHVCIVLQVQNDFLLVAVDNRNFVYVLLILRHDALLVNEGEN